MQLQCSNCNETLPPVFFNAKEPQPCPSCEKAVQAWVFPAFGRSRSAISSGEALTDSSQASCFYHPAKQATVACEACGRFICSLCEVEFDNAHLCPQCLDNGRGKGSVENLETSRVLYDNMALILALAPMLIFWLTIFTAPATLYVVIRYWKAPQTITKPRRRWKLLLAATVAVLQIAGWIALIVGLVFYKRHGH